jgi:uncharacterized protein (DUF1778 family)
MVETATREARQIIQDQTVFLLDQDAFDRFVEILETPVEPAEELRTLLSTRAPWD